MTLEEILSKRVCETADNLLKVTNTQFTFSNVIELANDIKNIIGVDAEKELYNILEGELNV